MSDLILHGGWVWTGLTPAPTPGGVLVRGSQVAAVGSEAELAAAARPGARRVHLEGRGILPGFVDAHVHLLSGGLDLTRVDLRAVDSRGAFEARIREEAARTPPGGWIVAWGWNDHKWGGALPHRSWLDRAAPGHPVLALRTDLHVGVASSEALIRAGIRDGDPDPPRGIFDREPDGVTLTGVLRERALERVQGSIPPLTEADRRAALLAASRHALAHGVTQLHDKGVLENSPESWASLETLRALRGEGALPLRVLASVPLDDRARLAAEIAERGRGDLWLRWGSVKAFVDGSLGAATAWFHDPYEPPFSGGGSGPGSGAGSSEGSGGDAGAWAGSPVADLEPLAAALHEAVALGLDPIVHAIGDRAVEWILEVYEGIAEAFADAGPGVYAPRSRPLRLRIEHVQHLRPGAAAALARRLANPAILSSMQPAHLVADGAWAETRIGAWRAPYAFPFRTLLDAGVPVAFGSDWTVAPLDPRAALAAAVTRALDAPGRPVWGGAERISLTEALTAHTLHAARGAFLEDATGTLEPGKEADMVIVDGALFSHAWAEGERPEAARIGAARAGAGADAPNPIPLETLALEATFVGGQVGWSRGGLLEGGGA
jgi:predicted amidohydrolase YtcJ